MTHARESQAGTEKARPERKPEMNATLGLPLAWFIPAALAVVVLAFVFTPAPGMTSGFAITMAIGGLLMVLGNAIPGFSKIGGGVILAILVPAILHTYDVMPDGAATAIEEFYDLSEFGEFIVAALIVGSILGMNRSVLIKAGSRIILPIIATIAICFSLFGFIGYITGYGAGKMLFFVVGPVLGGGVAAGAIPISELIATNSGGAAEDYLTQLVPAVVVANTVCIVIAGLLAWMGRRRTNLFRNFNGSGELASSKTDLSSPESPKIAPVQAVNATITGFFTAGVLFMAANAIAGFVPSIHSYVFLIIGCALAKIFLPIPDFIVDAADLWYRMVANAFIPAVLVAVSIVAIDFRSVISLLGDPIYMLSTVAVVIVAALAAGFIGWLVKLYFIESAISGGLGLADFGSSGDLAVLGAANRLELLPFLSISSRIGGGLVVLALSLLGPVLL